jgi:hypothetical protein
VQFVHQRDASGLDCQTASPYLWNTMTRIMLAFLALLTGLVASGAPAAQRACPLNGMEVGAAATPSRGERVEQRQGVAAQSEQPVWAERRSDCGQKPVRKPVYIPSVQLGIDRARE